MYSLYIYLIGKSKRVSSILNAEVSRWTAICAGFIAPMLFIEALFLENLLNLTLYALPLYGMAVLLAIPFSLELCLTSNDID